MLQETAILTKRKDNIFYSPINGAEKKGMIIMKIKVIAKNQFLFYMDGKVFLQSYESVVACKSVREAPILYKDWDYSRTTMKYVSKFLSDVFNKHVTKKVIDKMVKEGKIIIKNDVPNI